MPRPNELWRQVESEGGSADVMAERYRALLIEHGHLILKPKCYECSQAETSKIHHDPHVKGAHEFKPTLISEDPLLHVAYIEMSAEEARAHWGLARCMPESFERLIRHAVAHEFHILGGEQVQADYAAGRRGGYSFEIVNKKTGEKSTGIACAGSHPGERLKRCEFCRSRAGTDECDFVVGDKCKACKGTKYKGLKPCPKCAGRGVQLCNRRFCAKRGDGSCGVHLSKDEGYCPAHARERDVMPKPKVRREECRWVAEAKTEGTCLHKGCGNVVNVGVRCLYFPLRRRAMCAGCGEAYMEASA
jgi:hypothetical protein